MNWRAAILLCAAAPVSCRCGGSQPATAVEGAAEPAPAPAHAADAAVDALVEGDAALPRATTVNVSSLDRAALLPNGHVLVTAPEAILEWDPTGRAPIRRVFDRTIRPFLWSRVWVPRR